MQVLSKLYHENDTRLNWYYVLVCIVQLTLGSYFIFSLWPYFPGDMASYINIAKKYSQGSFMEGINAYWSPMLSWLLAPSFWLGIPPIYFFKLINILSALASLLLIIRNFELFRFQTITRIVLTAFFSFFLVYFAAESNTPDFLAIFFFLLFCFELLKTILQQSSVFRLSIVSIACFFAKSFFLAYVPVVLAAIVVYLVWKKEKTKYFTVIKALAVYMVVILTWAALLSIKYQRPILNSSARYNSWYITPNGFRPHFHSPSGIEQPQEKGMAFCWEDPTYYPVPMRSYFGSSEATNYTLGVWAYNLSILRYLFAYFSYFNIAIVLLWTAGIYLLAKEKVPMLIGFLITLYLAMYFIIFYEERYMLSCYALLILFSFYCVEKIVSRFTANSYVLGAALLITSVSFGKNPVNNFKQVSLYNQFNQQLVHKLYCLPESLQQELRNKKVASYNHISHLELIATTVGFTYFGEFTNNANDIPNYEELKKHDIEYFFYFDCDNFFNDECETRKLPFYLNDKTPIYRDEDFRMSVYKLK